MRYRRGRVHPLQKLDDPFYHFAWIPEYLAKLNSPVTMKFPKFKEQEYIIKELDDLIIDAYLLPFMAESV